MESFPIAGQGKMLEMAFFRIPFLVGEAANFLQDGKMVADCIYSISLLFCRESLILVDELFRQLPKSQILDLVLGFNEFSECQPAYSDRQGKFLSLRSIPIRALISSHTASVIFMSVICVSMLP